METNVSFSFPLNIQTGKRNSEIEACLTIQTPIVRQGITFSGRRRNELLVFQFSAESDGAVGTMGKKTCLKIIVTNSQS